MPILQLALLILGFLMLVKGADWFVDGCAGIASQLGIPQIVIGLTIVAMGTSAPEAAVSITAALRGNADISVGNILGSNILNILIILGLTSVISPLAIKEKTFCVEIPFMILVTGIFLVMGFTNSCISRMEGALLWAVFFLYLGYLFYLSRKEKEDTVTSNKSFVHLILAMLSGAAIIVIGSNVTVNAASNLARIIGLSERFIGLTIVAFGTSLPELVTSVTAAKKGNADIAIGNIVGSNIFNILFVIGTSALIVPISYDADFLADGIIAILSGAALWLLVLPTRTLKRSGGLLLLLGYAAYFIYLINCGG
jgi:cation:H+ antiporter